MSKHSLIESLEKPYNLFISYGRGDDDDFIKQLYENLTENGYKVWYDLESAESNGLSFLQNTRDALVDNPIRLILIVSPHALESEFVKAEWQFALENCMVIIPVLRMGLERNKKGEPMASDKDYELVPEPLQKRRLHCIDFRRERNYQDGLSDLLFSLSKGLKNLAALHGVINKPNNYIEREQEIESVKEFILKDAYQPTVITSVAKATAIQGMGGIGKSVIAAAMCHDCDIRRSFQDGIYWVTIGQNPDIQKALQYITKDDTINLRERYEQARDKLRAFLKDKNCLIVLDDVWKQEHIEIFPSDNALRCRLLITTRNKQTVKHLSNNTFEIGLLNNDDALLLLANASGKKLAELPNEAADIIGECGNLPLAISMIGSMIKAGDESTWKHSLTMLQEADIEVISQKFPDYPYPNLFKAIEISVNSLSEEDRHKYLQLGIFKEDARIPEEIIHILWKTESWKEYHTHNLINDFVERSILQRIDNGIYTLHDLQFDYIQKTATVLPAIHQQLVNNLGDPLKLSHAYSWNNYIWHLLKAGKQEAATLLLQNFDWIEAKLFASSTNELIKDYEHFSLDGSSDLIHRALKLSANVLVEDKNQLPSQLIGRLGNFENEPVMQLLKKAKMCKKTPWLRPVNPSLTPPGNLSCILKGHTGAIKSLLIHDNKIISWAYDSTIRIWEISSGQCLQILKGHTDVISSLAVYENKIISASYDSTIRIWEITSGNCLQTLLGHTEAVSSILVYDNKIISGSDDNTARIWEIDTGRCLQTLEGHACSYTLWTIVSVPPLLACDGKIISGSDDNNLNVWGIELGQRLHTLRGHTNWIRTLVASNCKIFSGSEDNTIRIWDINSGECLQTLSGHTGWPDQLLVHDTKVITCAHPFSQDSTIRIWDINSGECLHILEHNDVVSSFLIRDNKIISGSYDGTISIWDINSGKCLQILQGQVLEEPMPFEGTLLSQALGIEPKNGETDLSLRSTTSSPAAIGLLVSYDDKIISESAGIISIWDLSGKCIQLPGKHTGEVSSLLIHGNKIISGSYDTTIRIWEIPSAISSPVQKGHTSRITSLITRKDKIVSASYDSIICIWDTATGKCLHMIKHKGSITSLVATADKIISGSFEATIRIWDIETGSCLKTLTGHTHGINSLVEYGTKIISASNDSMIKIWDINSGDCLQTLKGHGSAVSSLSICDNKIISGSHDHTIRIWETASGKCINTLSGHSAPVSALLIHDNKIISLSHPSSSGSSIFIWDISSGQYLQKIQKSTGKIGSLLIHNNQIIGGTSDGHICIWEITSGRCVNTFRGHTGAIASLLIHQDKIISGSTDGTIYLLEIASAQCLQSIEAHPGRVSSLLIQDDKLISTDLLGLLAVHDLRTSTLISKYYSDAEYTTPVIFDNGKIICGDKSGQLHILEIIEV